MSRFWSFDRSLTGGFIVMGALALVTSTLAIVTAQTFLPRDLMRDESLHLVQALQVRDALQREISTVQAFLLSGSSEARTELQGARRGLLAATQRLRSGPRSQDFTRGLARIERLEAEHHGAVEGVLSLRGRGGSAEQIAGLHESNVLPKRGELSRAVEAMILGEEAALTSARSSERRNAESAQRWVLVVAATTFALFGAMVIALRSTLLRLYRVEAQRRFAADHAQKTAEALSVFQAENLEATRTSEQEFRATFEFAGVGHVQLEIPTARFLRVNPKMCELTGYRTAELNEMTLPAILQAEHRGRMAGVIERLARGEIGEHSVEAQLVRKHQQVIWTHMTLTLIRDPQGRPLRILAVVQDLSDLRRAQSALQATERRFQDMADSAPVLIWQSGPDKLHTWFNRAWLEFTGQTMAQELGEGWMDSVHPNDLERCRIDYHAAFDARRPFTMEYRLRHRDGEWRWMLDNGVPLRSQSGEFTGFIGSSVDISDRKRAEEQREQLLRRERAARNEAERTNRMKDEFLATLSHEMRTPLQAILGWSRLMVSERLDAHHLRRGLEVIQRNAAVQTRLIDDLLDMSRVVQGNLRLDVRRVEPSTVVEAAVEAVRPAADAKEIQLNTHLDPDAGPILADPQRLQQVVWNILSNAIKFTPKGGRIDVSLSRDGQGVRIVVADTGQGIRPEFLPHVFERFRQEDASTTRRQGGLGLGLAIVRQLIELHGGDVTVESAGEGQGATFTILMPIGAHRDLALEGPKRNGHAHAPDAVKAEGRLSGVRILVVDDESDTCELLKHLFGKSGAEVQAANSVAEALEAFHRHRPHVVVSDIGMPEQDGYELIRRIRMFGPEHGGSVPAIAMTAFARVEDRALAMRAGYQMHLAKPVELSDLMDAVASLAPSPDAR